MKLFVVSDIHGHAGLLKEALDEAGYDPGNQNHLLVCCGDLFDRGAENMEVLRFFEQMDRKIMVRGNHEDRLLDVFATGMLGNFGKGTGTVQTICEILQKNSLPDLDNPIDFSDKIDTVNRFVALIGEMCDYYETEHYVFVHGWLPNEEGKVLSDWRSASIEQWSKSRRARWIDVCRMSGHKEKKTIVCGHYPTPDSQILYGSGFIAIDACTDVHKRINVLVIDDQLLKEGA